MLEGERLSPCDEKNKPKTKLKDEGIKKKVNQEMRRPSRCHGPETNRTVPNRVEYEPEPEPNSTWPGLAWQQVADAVADDHEDHRRDRSVAPKTGDTSCVNKPLTR